MAAAVGLVIEYGGHTGAVVDLTESAAVIRVGSSQLKVPFGSDVRAEGLTVTLCRLDGVSGAQGSTQAEDALRTWRSEAAKRASVPAYVVLNDSELVGIAARRPTTLAELARCKGMGPIRLERWATNSWPLWTGWTASSSTSAARRTTSDRRRHRGMDQARVQPARLHSARWATPRRMIRRPSCNPPLAGRLQQSALS